MILLLESFASITEPLRAALDTVASPACRPKVLTRSMRRYRDQPDGPVLPKTWVAALHMTTHGSELLQQHRQEGRPPRARHPVDEEAGLRHYLIENKSNPHSIKSGSANHMLPCRYSTRDQSLGLIFWGIFRSEGGREIRFLEETKHNFRGVFVKKQSATSSN
jgi:hypothetical protein